MHIKKNGRAVGFGMAAGEDDTVSFGWPVKLTSPLEVTQGGTGGNSQATACANIGAVKKAGDTMTGDLLIRTNLYPSVKLTPTYNSTTNQTVFEGSYGRRVIIRRLGGFIRQQQANARSAQREIRAEYG